MPVIHLKVVSRHELINRARTIRYVFLLKPGHVTVERWENNQRMKVERFTRQEATNRYRYLVRQHGYKSSK